MTMFYQTKEGFFAGELIEEYGDSFLVKILVDNGVEVKESRYALVTHLTPRAADLVACSTTMHMMQTIRAFTFCPHCGVRLPSR